MSGVFVTVGGDARYHIHGDMPAFLVTHRPGSPRTHIQVTNPLPMTVTVHSALNGQAITVSIERVFTVDDLKSRITAQTGVPEIEQVLSMEGLGVNFAAGRSLASYGVQQDSEIIMGQLL